MIDTIQYFQPWMTITKTAMRSVAIVMATTNKHIHTALINEMVVYIYIKFMYIIGPFHGIGEVISKNEMFESK